jgi:filamentous hemagglutinin family protein
VVSGSATIQGQGGPAVIVNQSSSSAIINWNTFNIGANESVRFNQPSSSSVALNRVTGGLGPSEILGSLTANGRIFLINRDGILFGLGAVVNTAGFLATTHDIKNSDFMAGRYNFNIPGRPDASIVNQGRITATTGSFAALVAPGVRRLFELRPGKPRSLGHGSFRHNLGHGACERISDAYRGSSSGFPATGLSGSRKMPRARAAFRPW